MKKYEFSCTYKAVLSSTMVRPAGVVQQVPCTFASPLENHPTTVTFCNTHHNLIKRRGKHHNAFPLRVAAHQWRTAQQTQSMLTSYLLPSYYESPEEPPPCLLREFKVSLGYHLVLPVDAHQLRRAFMVAGDFVAGHSYLQSCIVFNHGKACWCCTTGSLYICVSTRKPSHHCYILQYPPQSYKTPR